MGTQNRRFSTIGNINAVEVDRVRLQAQIDSKKTINERKKAGQFATPNELAKEIISYGLSLQEERDISFLEPAMGTGSFYSALLNEIDLSDKKIKKAIGVEIDDDFFAAAKSLWSNNNISLINADFTALTCLDTVNFLISNPPYVRHHYIDQVRKSELSLLVKKETGLPLSGLAGLYCYFILLAHKWLAPNAICGWLVPSEFMDVNYGSTIKEYLLNDVHLLKIHRYNPDNCKFDDALVSSCVVWFKNEKVIDDYEVEFSYGGTHNEPEINGKVKKSILKKCKKWTHYPRNIAIEKSFKVNDSAPSLGDFFDIKRGLATGDNNFFILSKTQVDELELENDFLRPILPSPRYLRHNEVFSDSNGQPNLENRYYLLSCTIPEEELIEEYPHTWSYLQSGESATAEKYLCKSRKVWYFQENREATPFLCSYMGRGNEGNASPFRFILNHSNAIATNSYLMMYPKKALKEAILQSPDVLYKVWDALNNITPQDLIDEGRIYGGGLKKIEPRELSYVKCPLLANLLI